MERPNKKLNLRLMQSRLKIKRRRPNHSQLKLLSQWSLWIQTWHKPSPWAWTLSSSRIYLGTCSES